MAQEQFARPEYFTEFDPEKFVRDMKMLNDENKKNSQDEEKPNQQLSEEEIEANEMDAEGPTAE